MNWTLNGTCRLQTHAHETAVTHVSTEPTCSPHDSKLDQTLIRLLGSVQGKDYYPFSLLKDTSLRTLLSSKQERSWNRNVLIQSDDFFFFSNNGLYCKLILLQELLETRWHKSRYLKKKKKYIFKCFLSCVTSIRAKPTTTIGFTIYLCWFTRTVPHLHQLSTQNVKPPK